MSCIDTCGAGRRLPTCLTTSACLCLGDGHVIALRLAIVTIIKTQRVMRVSGHTVIPAICNVYILYKSL